jgi:hypothetical protein
MVREIRPSPNVIMGLVNQWIRVPIEVRSIMGLALARPWIEFIVATPITRPMPQAVIGERPANSSDNWILSPYCLRKPIVA